MSQDRKNKAKRSTSKKSTAKKSTKTAALRTRKPTNGKKGTFG